MHGRGEYEEDIVDRVRESGTDDPLTIELMQEVVYLRNEMAKMQKVIHNHTVQAALYRRRP